MKPDYLVPIKLNAIDLTDCRYRITRSTDVDLLSRSIDRVGLLNFPILQDTGDGYRIVAGFGRIGACSRLGWKEINARIFGRGVPETECLVAAIADNVFSRRMNIMEEAAAVVRLSKSFSDDHFKQTASALGLPVNPRLVDKYKRLFSLPKIVQDQMAKDILALNIALDFEALDEASIEAITRLFGILRPTVNQQRELLDHMRDIAANEDKSIADLVAEPLTADIVENDSLDRKQKITLLRQAIRNRRYPALTHAERAFQQHHRALGLPDDLALLAPKDFESTDYRFVVTFRTASELKEKAEQVKALSDHPELQSILNREFENT